MVTRWRISNCRIAPIQVGMKRIEQTVNEVAVVDGDVGVSVLAGQARLEESAQVVDGVRPGVVQRQIHARVAEVAQTEVGGSSRDRSKNSRCRGSQPRTSSSGLAARCSRCHHYCRDPPRRNCRNRSDWDKQSNTDSPPWIRCTRCSRPRPWKFHVPQTRSRCESSEFRYFQDLFHLNYPYQHR